MDVPIPEKPEDRMEMISQVFTSPKHLIVFRALTRNDSWASVAHIVKKTKVSKRTVYRIIKDFTKGNILESKTVSRRRMYRLAKDIRWVGTLIEEPKVELRVKDLPGRDRVNNFLSQDKLARDIINSLLQASDPLTLRQISAESGAWAIEVKSRLNRMIDEGLVLKRDLGYMPNRKIAFEIMKEVTF